MVVALALLLAWWSKARCVFDGGWQGGEQFHGYCYSDLVALWSARGLADGRIPYIDQPLEYPPLIGAQMWITALLTRAWGGGVVGFYNLNAGLNAAFVVATLALLRRLRIPTSRQLWWAGGPPLVFYATLNWDALPVLLLVLAVALHVVGRDGAAGVAAGLGAAAKLFPALVVPLMVTARLRQRDRLAAARHIAGAAAAWAAVNVPLALVTPEGWSHFFAVSRDRGASGATIWALADELDLVQLDRAALNRTSALAFAAGALAIAAIGLRRRAPAATWSLVLPLLAWFLVTNKVFSPQYDLWLVPLLAVLLPRAGPFAAFVAADVAVFATEFAYLGGRVGFEPHLGYGPLGVAVALRAAVLVWIIVVSLRGASPGPPALPLGRSAPGVKPHAGLQYGPGQLHA
ncbi:MAG: DUF2029 domain-containing protein [Actinobacteria bacterium]|nr:DUF2029 domain-containing protein [Actinomycetota bacterium]